MVIVTDPLEETISELRSARIRKGIPQTEVALYIGTTQSAVARLEAAQSDPRLGTVQRYAEAVGMRLTVVPMRPGGPSLALTAEGVRAELAADDPDGALRHVIQFLDDLARQAPELRRQAVRDEPERVNIHWDALLAGIAEYASQRFGFAVPGWAAAPSRFLRNFWFVIEDLLGRPAPGLAAMAFVRSPSALANRGVFLDNDSLVSV